MFLIDGYNLMHAAGLMKTRFGPGGLEKARRALIGVLAGSLGEEASRTIIIFDARTGRPDDRFQGQPPAVHGIRLEFASAADGADARIEQLIRQDSAPAQLTVISSDSRIRAAARRRGAAAIPSEKFWDEFVVRRLPRTQSAPIADKPARVRDSSDEWVKEFEGLISADDLQELAGPFADESQ
jgi:predicted RNA-binding protein with PIN domain